MVDEGGICFKKEFKFFIPVVICSYCSFGLRLFSGVLFFFSFYICAARLIMLYHFLISRTDTSCIIDLPGLCLVHVVVEAVGFCKSWNIFILRQVYI